MEVSEYKVPTGGFRRDKRHPECTLRFPRGVGTAEVPFPDGREEGLGELAARSQGSQRRREVDAR